MNNVAKKNLIDLFKMYEIDSSSTKNRLSAIVGGNTISATTYVVDSSGNKTPGDIEVDLSA
jgi:hypothetical protein